MADPWEEDAWADETDHSPPRERRHLEEGPEPATSWRSFLPAALLLGGFAAISLALGGYYVGRSGISGAIGAIIFFAAAVGLIFMIARGSIRLARTGTTAHRD